MERGKSINLFLMDGNVNGRIKCTLANWTGLAFKIPRTSLNACKNRDELKQTGIYFLFGRDEATNKGIVYIGQAGVRKNGEGILTRLLEHNRNNQKDYWTEAIAITTSNDILGPTEISYLENRLYQLAKEANRYIVKNGNEPTLGNPTEEKQSELEEFIDYSKILVGTLGHKVFEPLIIETNTQNELELHCAGNGAKAIGIRTADGFVVKKGSILSDHFTNSCPKYTKKKREHYQDIIYDHTLLEDILFNTPSGAASFVLGRSANGYIEWKNDEGLSLKQLNQ
ncbi:GIY-YIG nuclease family protein [uncultured Catenibacterium sp.]|uniref:GIY-YIG nuclease family protein n=1 Tax=uncultured Catenibacterium sp. TaxID=286142 RepID=UPI0025CF2975|nr:GIY-YIG nuclease family protein [uncultured Catenibacterium sp.]